MHPFPVHLVLSMIIRTPAKHAMYICACVKGVAVVIVEISFVPRPHPLRGEVKFITTRSLVHDVIL